MLDAIGVGILVAQLLVLLFLLRQTGILVVRGDILLKELENLRGRSHEALELQREIASRPLPSPLAAPPEVGPQEMSSQLEERRPPTPFSGKVEVVRDGVTLQVLDYSPDLEIDDAIFSSPRHWLVHQGVPFHEKQDWLNHCVTVED